MPVPDQPVLPRFAHLRARPEWACIDFISDLHLSPDTPDTLHAWSRYLTYTSAQAVFILGDLFEAWVGDDSRQGSFEADCAAVLKSAAGRRWIGFMRGNRDFLIGTELLDECNVELLHDPTVLSAFDIRVLLSHGDELCLSDIEYQHFRKQVRSAAWQQAFLARPLTERRELARHMREGSEQRKTIGANPASWFDLDRDAIASWARAADATVMVHGHTHRAGDEQIGPDLWRRVLSDWDLEGASVGHEPRAEVLRLTANGFERLSPLSAED